MWYWATQGCVTARIFHRLGVVLRSGGTIFVTNLQVRTCLSLAFLQVPSPWESVMLWHREEGRACGNVFTGASKWVSPRWLRYCIGCWVSSCTIYLTDDRIQVAILILQKATCVAHCSSIGTEPILRRTCGWFLNLRILLMSWNCCEMQPTVVPILWNNILIIIYNIDPAAFPCRTPFYIFFTFDVCQVVVYPFVLLIQ